MIPNGKKTTIAFIALAVFFLLIIQGMFSSWPMDGDETSRLLETAYVIKGHIPFFDAMIMLSVPGFWILEIPILVLIPPGMIPWAARILGLAGLFCSLALLYFICAKTGRGRSGWEFLASAALLALGPELILKVSECRPDSLAASFALAGALIFFTADTNRGSIWGGILLGLAVSLRLEMGIVLLSLYFALAVSWNKTGFEKGRIMAAAIPPLAVFITIAIWARQHTFDLLMKMPFFFRIAQSGKGDTSMSLPVYEIPLIAAVALLGIYGMIRFIRRSKDPGLRAFGLFTLTSVILIFLLHQKAGAKFHQNYWSQIYFLAPFAGITVTDFFKTRAWLPVYVALLVSVVLVFVAVIGNNQIATGEMLERNQARWEQVLSDDQNSKMIITDQYEYIGNYSPAQLSEFYRTLDQRFPGGFLIYANDFRIPFGRMVPERIAAKLSTLERTRDRLLKTEKGRVVAKELYARFPQGAFIIDGEFGTPADLLMSLNPDVLLGDDYLWRMAVGDGDFAKMLSRDYRMEKWADVFTVFVKGPSMADGPG